jgi:hypothetical protein
MATQGVTREALGDYDEIGDLECSVCSAVVWSREMSEPEPCQHVVITCSASSEVPSYCSEELQDLRGDKADPEVVEPEELDELVEIAAGMLGVPIRVYEISGNDDVFLVTAGAELRET